MAKCDGCGAESPHTRTIYNEDAEVVGGECRQCKPENFAAPFDPGNKLVLGHVANPHLYTRDAEGVYQAKDELIADFVDSIQKGPTAEAIERKRSTRRTHPMSEAEIADAQEWGMQRLKPALEAQRRRVN